MHHHLKARGMNDHHVLCCILKPKTHFRFVDFNNSPATQHGGIRLYRSTWQQPKYCETLSKGQEIVLPNPYLILPLEVATHIMRRHNESQGQLQYG